MEYSQEVKKAICDRIATTTDTLTAICAGEGMPTDRVVRMWVYSDPEFAKMFNAAREAQQDLFMEQCGEIVDSADVGDWQVAKLRVEHRRWMAGKLKPKTYGDKVTHSSDPDAPLVTNPSADALIAFLLAKGASEHEIRAFIAAPDVIEHNPSKDKV
jgi:hypothetical protein